MSNHSPRSRTQRTRHFTLLSGLAALALMVLPTGASANEPTRTTHQDWQSVCLEVDGSERCQIQQTLEMEGAEGRGPAMQVNIRDMRDGTRIIEVLLPLGLDLRGGIVMQVDDGTEYNAPFLTCFEQGCLTARPLDPELEEAMRSGTNMRVGFRPFNNEQIIVADISLMGFTAASRQIK
ncbi:MULTISPECIES: invasion associated locus B family protein [Ectothiorhodospira]|jgi:invasion protein IalB|uniref:Invasion protein IalB, involved in pathogenesis n=1 Tax=Ectothiorhodospira marina TaxID=1396821 RepID=A0A1H7FY55_9GAMM|nr:MULTISPECIES: invasion associated locus B family protein [Ectothiorhodospira]MCG5516419.1 invasion associated locus B family protein [Ectothiorhodospira sp. 9100]MCG5519487.1 invasion associated locus B family protein [Ectothiorhodospira sp. 9905]SEK30869.1 Invasion protein IalB, involved in pathogenesis [Ectothiorhodospira marina]